jgi:hypothetical protein
MKYAIKLIFFVCALFYVLFGSWKNILLGNHSFIDFWSCHLPASSLASEVHGPSHEPILKAAHGSYSLIYGE